MGTAIFAGLIVVAIGIGSFALDIAHIAAVQTELQNGVDAAALAGARELANNNSDPQTRALMVAGENTADGRFLSNASPNTTVSAFLTPPTATTPGQVRVTADMTIRHLFAPIFGKQTEQLHAVATAGTTGTITGIACDMTFPMVASIDAVPTDKGVPMGPALKDLRVGDPVDFYINSQQVKNAAFTSFTESSANANYIQDAVDANLGLIELDPCVIPSINIGDDININNGVVGQKKLAKDDRGEIFTNDWLIFIPVVSGPVPINQSRPVLGFIAVEVSSVELNKSGGEVEVIHGTLVRRAAPSIGGTIPSTGNNSWNNALNSLSPGAIKLLPSS